eukprot:tig00000254_g22544.t1
MARSPRRRHVQRSPSENVHLDFVWKLPPAGVIALLAASPPSPPRRPSSGAARRAAPHRAVRLDPPRSFPSSQVADAYRRYSAALASVTWLAAAARLQRLVDEAERRAGLAEAENARLRSAPSSRAAPAESAGLF